MEIYAFIVQLINRKSLALDQKGQSTAEYSLVILGAAAIALLLLAWAGSTGAISNLFESVISRVLSKNP